MRLLLDTNAFAWWMVEPTRLTRDAYDAIRAPENDIYLSAASIWEMSIKHHMGRWPEAGAILADLGRLLATPDFVQLSVTATHGLEAGRLNGPHRDPFDRLLIAQAVVESLRIVTNDRVFRAYGVPTLWGG